eukprot:12943210-Alexandrium_andersonii.AAC.1
MRPPGFRLIHLILILETPCRSGPSSGPFTHTDNVGGLVALNLTALLADSRELHRVRQVR